MNIPLILDTLARGAVLGVDAIIIWALLTASRRDAVTVAALPLAFCLIGEVIADSIAAQALVPWPVLAVLTGIAVGNGALFWFFAQALFDDEFRFHKGLIAVWAATFLFTTWNCLMGDSLVWAHYVMRFLPLAFALCVIREAWHNHAADLVEPRRRLRNFILALGVGYTILFVMVRLVTKHGQLLGLAAPADAAILLLMVFAVARYLVRNPASLQLAVPSPEAPVPIVAPAPGRDGDPADVDPQVHAALTRAMDEERIYRNENLTVVRLADKIQLPEYRLRRHINQTLGYRNFNAYLNAYRLKDAKAMLADPTKRSISILAVALEAGFQSIGPFNRAFKDATRQTPSDFRRQALADS